MYIFLNLYSKLSGKTVYISFSMDVLQAHSSHKPAESIPKYTRYRYKSVKMNLSSNIEGTKTINGFFFSRIPPFRI